MSDIAFAWASGYGWGIATILALNGLAQFLFNDYMGRK